MDSEALETFLIGTVVVTPRARSSLVVFVVCSDLVAPSP